MGKTATEASTAAPARPGATGVDTGRRTGLERADVVAAALDLVEREGPGALSMRRLATELDVGTPTIYWHIGSRDELVAAVVRAAAERMADRPVRGRTPRERVLAAATHLCEGAVENRAVTSLAHQTATTPLLLHQLEVVLVRELEAAGLTGRAAAEAFDALIVVVTGALVLALRDPAKVPEAYRPDALWAAGGDEIGGSTRAALRAGTDLDAVTAAALRAVVDQHVPARRPTRKGRP